MGLTEKIFCAMTEYENSPKRIQHFVKVWAFARMIGLAEQLDEREQLILEIAALTHDIGIKPALVKYGSSAGKYQEEEGPYEAERLLSRFTKDRQLIDRVRYLIGHHHTYDCVDGTDYRILVEADFLVNAYEDKLSTESIKNAYESIFKTKEGRRILEEAYLK